jgi:ParB/RepB/Spo0J family partition protein
MMKVSDIDVDAIIIGDRFRKDLGNIDELAQSIQEKGLLQPISVREIGDGTYKLLAGGRRMAAILKSKIGTVPCIIRESDDIDEKEVELYENIHRKDLVWHERAGLEKEIEALKTAQNPNWTQREQAQLLNTSLGSVNRRLQLAEYIDAVPELKTLQNEDQAWKAIKRIEEGYMIDALARKREVRNLGEPDKDKGYAALAPGHYRLGDAFAGMALAQPGAMHFAEVDPPYGIELDRRKARGKVDKMVNYEEVPGEQYVDFTRRLGKEVFRILDRNAFAVWWYGIEWHHMVLSELREIGFKVSSIPAIWYKGAQGQTASPDTMLASSYENFFVLRKGDPKLAKPGRSNVFAFSPVPPVRKTHPTEKPIELMLEIMETFLYPGSRVLVPFLGSGVTLRACYRTNHVGVGWDMSAEYKKKFLMRVDEDHLLGIKPKLIKAAGEE